MSMTKRNSNYFLNEVYPRISGQKVVLTGDSALVLTGYSNTGDVSPDLLVDSVQEFRINVENMVRYYYTNGLDLINYVTRFRDTSVLVPTAERTFVEQIAHKLKAIDDGTFCESFSFYLRSNKNLSKLYEVSDFFKLPRKDLEYWMNEAREYDKY